VAPSRTDTSGNRIIPFAAPAKKPGPIRWSARPDLDTGHRVPAAGLLVVAGADLDALAEWVDEGRRRAIAAMLSA
jgi:hypothetical protein